MSWEFDQIKHLSSEDQHFIMKAHEVNAEAQSRLANDLRSEARQKQNQADTAAFHAKESYKLADEIRQSLNGYLPKSE